MSYYIKKPIVIMAVRFGENDFEEWNPWVQKNYAEEKWRYRLDNNTGKRNGFVVETLEGEMSGGQGDYLVMGVKGELYPCRGDIFEETYEKAVVDESVSD